MASVENEIVATSYFLKAIDRKAYGLVDRNAQVEPKHGDDQRVDERSSKHDQRCGIAHITPKTCARFLVQV